MKVAITGGTGFIGNRLVATLNNDPRVSQLKLFARKTSVRPESFNSPKVTICEGELTDLSSLQKLVHGADVVVHLAADMDFYPDDLSHLYKINVEGTRNMVSACQVEKVKRFIYISTTETIGATSEKPADETTACKPVYEYGKSKVEAEAIVREQIPKIKGMDYIILRPTGVFGEEDTFSIFELMKMIQNGLLCVIPGSGEALLMYTYVQDVVDGIILSIFTTSIHNETFILCADQPLKYKDWIYIISEELNRTRPFLSVPLPLMKLGVYLISPIMNRGKKRFMYEPKTIERISENRNYSNEKMKRLLGFQPKYGLEKALRQTLRDDLRRGRLRRYPVSPFLFISFCLMFLSSSIGLFTYVMYFGSRK